MTKHTRLQLLAILFILKITMVLTMSLSSLITQTRLMEFFKLDLTWKLSAAIITDIILGSNISEIIRAGGGHDYVVGGLGNDYIYGGAGNDYLVGGLSTVDFNDPYTRRSSSDYEVPEGYSDDDYLVGGAGQDMIIGGKGNDIIICGEEAYEAGSTDQIGDWAVGGEGDDIIFGSRDCDVLHGGAGRDYIWGGGGDDIILGDGDLYQEAFYGETPQGGLMGIEFQQVFYKDNQGLLWRTEIAPDGNNR